MSQSERDAWDSRYATGDYVPRATPSRFFERWLPQVLKSREGSAESSAAMPSLRALDVATGTGRHALRLAEAGFAVDAVDISEVALTFGERVAADRGLEVNWICADLDEFRPAHGYDLVTVFRYRNRALWPLLVEAVGDSGWLLVEHHLQTTAAVDGPQNPDFRLAPGELLDSFGSLRVLHYSEQVEKGDRPDSVHAVARLAACGGSPGW